MIDQRDDLVFSQGEGEGEGDNNLSPSLLKWSEKQINPQIRQLLENDAEFFLRQSLALNSEAADRILYHYLENGFSFKNSMGNVLT